MSRLRGWLDALLVYRQPRVAAMLLLGFSAGLPFMLVFQTLSAWLRQVGVERATIGMLAWVGILYSIKFLWAPIVDRLPLPLLTRWLGRRRSWMLLAQVGVVAGLLYVAHTDPATSLRPVALGALFIAFCSATQDIALDAWRIESAPIYLQGAMAAAYQLGYRVAIMTGTAGALWIASDAGWSTAYTTMGLLMGIGIVTTLLIPEPQVSTPRASALTEERVIEWLERRAHWPEPLRRAGGWLFDAVLAPLIDFFARYGLVLGLLIFGFICTYRLTDYAMGVMANPFYLDHGYTLKEVAAVVKGFGLGMAILGVLLGGTVVAKLGTVRALVLGSVLVIVSNLSFSLLAASGERTLLGLAIVNSLDNLALGVHGTALIAFLSSLTSSRYTATQYALLSSLYALPGKLLMGGSGFVVDALDYPAFFVYTASLSLPGLVLLYLLVRKLPQADQSALEARKPAWESIVMTAQTKAAAPTTEPQLVGIAGWLVLPAVGLVFGAILEVVSLSVGLQSFSDVAAAGYGRLYAMELLADGGVLVFRIYAATRFFGKRRNAPSIIIALITASLVASALLPAIELAAGAEELALQRVKPLVLGIIGAFIWIPYFSVSKRVKATFVN